MNFLSLDFAPHWLHHYIMKLIIIPHGVTLTKAIEDHIVAKIEKLDHFDKRAIDARVTLEHDHNRAPEKQFSCSVKLAVRGPDLFAEDREEDLYAAIDLAIKKNRSPDPQTPQQGQGKTPHRSLQDQTKAQRARAVSGA